MRHRMAGNRTVAWRAPSHGPKGAHRPRRSANRSAWRSAVAGARGCLRRRSRAPVQWAWPAAEHAGRPREPLVRVICVVEVESTTALATVLSRPSPSNAMGAAAACPIGATPAAG
jgi:hypothetical protein